MQDTDEDSILFQLAQAWFFLTVVSELSVFGSKLVSVTDNGITGFYLNFMLKGEFLIV